MTKYSDSSLLQSIFFYASMMRIIHPIKVSVCEFVRFLYSYSLFIFIQVLQRFFSTAHCIKPNKIGKNRPNKKKSTYEKHQKAFVPWNVSHLVKK